MSRPVGAGKRYNYKSMAAAVCEHTAAVLCLADGGVVLAVSANRPVQSGILPVPGACALEHWLAETANATTIRRKAYG